MGIKIGTALLSSNLHVLYTNAFTVLALNLFIYLLIYLFVLLAQIYFLLILTIVIIDKCKNLAMTILISLHNSNNFIGNNLK